MGKQIYEITPQGINELARDQYDTRDLKKTCIYIIDLVIQERNELAGLLNGFPIDEDILASVTNPADNIRFRMTNGQTYGELAFFSSKASAPLTYIGVIGYDNILFLIHEELEELSGEIINAISSAIKDDMSKIDLDFMLYIVIHEILTHYGHLILSYREEIEEFARDFNADENGIDPDEFLQSKTLISNFSRVFEKLFFTLNFPPVKDIMDKESTYQLYFKDLLKNIGILKLSLSQTEERLNSLHDHYLLLLQEKSNRRINFLTVIQAIFVPITLIASIYGMNFQYMPELNFKYGYFISLGGMVLIAVGFLRYFYKHGWFD
jgi:magnesium transporter